MKTPNAQGALVLFILIATWSITRIPSSAPYIVVGGATAIVFGLRYRVFYLWLAWLIYGSIWAQHQLYGGVPAHVTSLFYVLGALFSDFARFDSEDLECLEKKPKKKVQAMTQILFFLCFFFPHKGNCFQYMDGTWEVLLHVSIYLLTFFYQYYTTMYLKWGTPLYVSTIWPLLVVKWYIPFIGIQWMYYAYELSSTLSKLQKEEGSVQPPVNLEAHGATAVSVVPEAASKTRPQWKAWSNKNRPGKILGQGVHHSAQLAALLQKGQKITPIIGI